MVKLTSPYLPTSLKPKVGQNLQKIWQPSHKNIVKKAEHSED